MSILSRYIARQVIFVFTLTLVTLTGVLWLTQALEQLSLLTEKGQTLELFLKFTALSLPGLLIVIAPVALFIACIYTLNRLNSDSELIVIGASGGSSWAIVRPIMIVAFLVTGLMYVASLYLVPLSWKLLRYLITDIRADVLTSIVAPGQFSSPEKGLVFHVRARDDDGTLRGLLVYDRREKDQVFTYLAERARMVAEDENAVLVMENGSVQQKEASGPGDNSAAFSMVVFDRYVLDISQFNKQRKVPSLKPRERGMQELLNPPEDDPRWRHSPGKFRSEIVERFAGPIYVLVYAAIALAAVGSPRSNRQQAWMGLIFAILAVLAVRLGGFGITNLSVKNPNAAYVSLALPIVVFVLATIFTLRGGARSELIAKIGALIENLIEKAIELPKRRALRQRAELS